MFCRIVLKGVARKYSLIGYTGQILKDFQKDVNSFFFEMNFSRTGQKAGDILNSVGEKIGSYNIKLENY